MGTWDDGLLDNDTAHDGLGDLRHQVVDDIVEAASAERLAAAIGVLLQLSDYDFGLETPSGPRIVAAVTGQAKAIEKLPPAAREIVEAVGQGRGQELGKQRDTMAADVVDALSADSATTPFGRREPALFESRAAAEYVQDVAARCIDAVDADFEDEGNWADLCREGAGMGMLAVLLVIAPCKVERAKLEEWRQKAKQGLAALEEDEDDELEFHRGYYANVDHVFARLIERY